MLLISQAIRCCEDKDWPLAESLATEAINHNIMLHTAYMVRARARRFQRKFDEAIQDYTTVLELDPENSDALMFRGATFMDQSSCENDYRRTSAMIANRAFCDFKQASAINPSHVGIGLSIVEVGLCVGRYREAIGTAGSCWSRAGCRHEKIVCAWLGSMALILAGKPERKWAHYVEYLQRETAGIDGYWNSHSVDRLFQHLEKVGFDNERLEGGLAIHRLFVTRFDPDDKRLCSN
jgi:hypothetical protein